MAQLQTFTLLIKENKNIYRFIDSLLSKSIEKTAERKEVNLLDSITLAKDIVGAVERCSAQKDVFQNPNKSLGTYNQANNQAKQITKQKATNKQAVKVSRLKQPFRGVLLNRCS